MEELKRELENLQRKYCHYFYDQGFSRQAFFLLERIHEIETKLGLELTRC